ncbi:MAG: hypothetical protein KKG59_02935 [Nanoarchaeota archaeon]|nr:hypothetical protein [Nanoarchaeota archaeon]
MVEESSDLLELGGNIKLAGFGTLEKSELIVVKKIVGSYARRFSDRHSDFESLHVTMKLTHKREKSEKYEIMGKLLLGGSPNNSSDVDRNLFFCLDSVLKKLDTTASKKI